MTSAADPTLAAPKRASAATLPLQLLYATTIFTSAFLLFLVQPLIGKQILPWFGGSAAVWSVCLVFFQGVLLAGYAYADVVMRRLPAGPRTALHVGLMLASLALLPIVADADWKPHGDDDPTLRILGLLLATIGLPYFLLSTTGPLVQAWVARQPWGGRVYRYFSLSNLASLLSLLAYPVLVEPHAALALQAGGWSWAYAAFVLLCSGVAVHAWLGARAPDVQAAAPAGPPPATVPAPRWREQLPWLVLPGLASWLLLAVTNHLTRDVAVIPFLWVLPLVLYLLSFVLTFESDRWYHRRTWAVLAAVLVLLGAYGLQERLGSRVAVEIPVYCAGLFVLAMVLHGETARRRPASTHLTRYYLMLSLGGALGGSLVGLAAPVVLPDYYELGLGYVLAALVGAWLATSRAGRTVGLVVALACALLLGAQVQDDASRARRMLRNFYGTLSTYDLQRDAPVREMFHGSVKHGSQYLEPARRREATTYYGLTSGIGRLLTLPSAHPRRIAMVGLGAGTLAVYGRPGDVLQVYELDPEVVTLAQQEFTFLADTAARVGYSIGDARLALEREPPQAYDVLAVDAFTGDAVPVHLITVEAMRVYLKHLKPDGIVAFHLTNRFLNLPPVVERVAASLSLHVLRIRDEAEGSSLRATDWVLVSRNAAALQAPELQAAARPIAPIAGLRAWTDDFNDLFSVVR